ncbi:unnamed protein product [Ilex paraguariensis]|uniref:Uncharacterized protein n=1 Tax=Ilex paraguariensis TaxID=185542 RepID=A0ABC8SDJ8_9AQUA
MELGQFRVAPDQREKFLQRFQQVQQQGQSTLLGMPPLAGGNHKQFSAQQQNTLLQQKQDHLLHPQSGYHPKHLVDNGPIISFESAHHSSAHVLVPSLWPNREPLYQGDRGCT